MKFGGAVKRVARGCNDGRVAKRFLQIPELVVGFDTETTGLDVTIERAISLTDSAPTDNGRPSGVNIFLWCPTDRYRLAPKRCTWTLGLKTSRQGSSLRLVYTVETGLNEPQNLRRYQEQNAYFVGSNLLRFDVEMLFHSYRSVFLSTPEKLTD